jgi:hypothetical protein
MEAGKKVEKSKKFFVLGAEAQGLYSLGMRFHSRLTFSDYLSRSFEHFFVMLYQSCRSMIDVKGRLDSHGRCLSQLTT